MGSIRIKDLREDEAREGGPEKDYPAMLIGNMGVELASPKRRPYTSSNHN
jgi:hypothetical protein